MLFELKQKNLNRSKNEEKYGFKSGHAMRYFTQQTLHKNVDLGKSVVERSLNLKKILRIHST